MALGSDDAKIDLTDYDDVRHMYKYKPGELVI